MHSGRPTRPLRGFGVRLSSERGLFGASLLRTVPGVDEHLGTLSSRPVCLWPFGVRDRGGAEHWGPNGAWRGPVFDKDGLRNIVIRPVLDDELREGSGASGAFCDPFGGRETLVMPMNAREMITWAQAIRNEALRSVRSGWRSEWSSSEPHPVKGSAIVSRECGLSEVGL